MVKKSAVTPMMKELWAHLFKKPATSKYPLVKAEVPDGLRGRQVDDNNLCISCGLCARDCPANDIVMVEVDGEMRPLLR